MGGRAGGVGGGGWGVGVEGNDNTSEHAKRQPGTHFS